VGGVEYGDAGGLRAVADASYELRERLHLLCAYIVIAA